MNKFIVNYHTGIKDVVEACDLDEVKEIAEESMSYTQEKVTIETLEGEVLATSRWYGVCPEEGEDVLLRFGDFGYYTKWIIYG